MPDINNLEIKKLQQQLASQKITAVELTQYFLDRIERFNPALNCFITVLSDTALLQAAASDERRSRGKALGPLDGIPIAVKDNIDVAGVATSAGIEARKDRIAASDAFCISQLKNAGVVILGKTNMDEAAMSCINDNPFFGRCFNPFGNNMTPGGSSGGSASAVAAGLCAAALGTDTMGSIRIPASYCGVSGMKGSYGLVSQSGVVPLSWSHDHIGVLARGVENCATVFQTLVAHDVNDPHSKPAPNSYDLTLPSRDLNNLIIGKLKLHGLAEVGPDILSAYDKAAEVLATLGATIKEISLDQYDPDEIIFHGFMVGGSEAAEFHSDDIKKNPGLFSKEILGRLSSMESMDKDDIDDSRSALKSVTTMMDLVFNEVDALITPTTAEVAFDFDSEVSLYQTVFTALANFAGSPAIAVPMGCNEANMPVSLQIMTAQFNDSLALSIAEIYEKATGDKFLPPNF